MRQAPGLFLPRLQAIKVASGTGITLHMFNSSDCLMEDITIHAAPYFACVTVLLKLNFTVQPPAFLRH